MSAKKAWVDGVIESAKARFLTIIVWTVIVVAIYAIIQVNRSNHATTVANLGSDNAAVRQAEVLKWADKDQLADALASTQDPNTDDKSDANVKSKSIRETCTADFVSMIAAGKVGDDLAMDNLYALHKDSDSMVKSATVDGLTAIGKKSDQNVVKIVARLADGDPDVRGAASDTLGKIGGDFVIARLVDAINGKPAGAKDDALSTLPKVGKPASPAIIGLLDTPDLTFKGKLITLLGTIGDPKCIPTLQEQAIAPPRDPQIRRLALLSLSSVVVGALPSKAALDQVAAAAAKAIAAGKPAPKVDLPTAQDARLAIASAPVLIEALGSSSDDSKARALCALALGRIKTQAAIDALVGALGDIDTQVSKSARTGLETVGPAAVPALAVAVKSPVEQIRAGAAYALGGIGNSTALTALAPALTDTSVAVRQAVCEALGHSANPASIPLLVARLSDANGFVAGAASISLVDVGKPAAPALVAVLGSDSPTAPIYASRALRSIGSDAASLVMAAAQNGSDRQKTWSAVVLGWLHEPSARPILQKLVESADPSVKFAAQQALQQYSAS